MEIVAVPYCVDIEKIKTVFGCKDPQIYESIKQTHTFKELNQKVKFQKELQNIIFNYIPEEKRFILPFNFFKIINIKRSNGLNGKWYKYGYALLSICDYLGETIIPDEKVLYYNKQWWKLNTILRENGSDLDLGRMIQSRQLFDTPFEKSQISNNYYNKNEIKQFIEILNKIENKIDNETTALYNPIKNGLENCYRKNCEWVSFSYKTEKNILKYQLQ